MPEIKNLHLLPAETMLSNSHIWLQDPTIVQAIDVRPLGAGALGEVRGAHDILAGALGWKQRLGATLLEMTRRITETDREHDRLVRVLYNALTSLTDLASDPDEAARYLTVRDMLLPEGLTVVNYSYAREHGAVLEVEQRMTPDVEQFLQQTPIGSRSMLEVYQRWVAAGKQLGALVKERARIEASMQLSAEGAPTHVREARHAWLRAVRVFTVALDLLALDPDVQRAVLAPLESDVADALAAIRARADRDDEGLGEDGAPLDGDGEPAEGGDGELADGGDGEPADGGDGEPADDAPEGDIDA